MDPGCDMSFDDLLVFNLDFIRLRREEKISDSFIYNGWRFDSDDRARANISGAATLALAQGGMPSNFTWRDADNIDRPMSGMDIINLGSALFQHVATNYYTYRTHKANILSITDYDTLVAYDSTTSWVD